MQKKNEKGGEESHATTIAMCYVPLGYGRLTSWLRFRIHLFMLNQSCVLNLEIVKYLQIQ